MIELAWLGQEGLDRIEQDRIEQAWLGYYRNLWGIIVQDIIEQDEKGQERMEQDRIRQEKIRQDRIVQDKIGQHRMSIE